MSGDNIDIKALCENFDFQGRFLSSEIIQNGHINNTFILHFEDGDGKKSDYLIQKINTTVFRQPIELMENIVGVTEYLRRLIALEGGNPERETMKVFYSKNNLPYFVDGDNEYWRCLSYVDNTYTCNLPDNAEICYKAGKAFGKFQCRLADYPIDTLHETIPNFHNTPSRVEALKKAVKDNLAGRAGGVQKEIEFALARENEAGLLLALLDKGELALKVTHNDTKLNNILFDCCTGDGICIVDLDTVMPGLSLYDFGDSLRFAGNTANEDEKDLSLVSFNLDVYENYTRGYLEAAGISLSPAEIKYLPFSCKLMTYECGTRFLTDYLNGDTYFKTAYPEHNLDRCHTQFELVADIEKKYDRLNSITAELAKQILGAGVALE